MYTFKTRRGQMKKNTKMMIPWGSFCRKRKKRIPGLELERPFFLGQCHPTARWE